MSRKGSVKYLVTARWNIARDRAEKWAFERKYSRLRPLLGSFYFALPNALWFMVLTKASEEWIAASGHQTAQGTVEERNYAKNKGHNNETGWNTSRMQTSDELLTNIVSRRGHRNWAKSIWNGTTGEACFPRGKAAVRPWRRKKTNTKFTLENIHFAYLLVLGVFYKEQIPKAHQLSMHLFWLKYNYLFFFFLF